MSLDHNPRSDTSRMAAIENRPRRPRDRDRALAALLEAGSAGLNDFELADKMSRDGHGAISQTSAGKRRHDLGSVGLVARLTEADGTPVRRPSHTGRPASVWVHWLHDHPF